MTMIPLTSGPWYSYGFTICVLSMVSAKHVVLLVVFPMKMYFPLFPLGLLFSLPQSSFLVDQVCNLSLSLFQTSLFNYHPNLCSLLKPGAGFHHPLTQLDDQWLRGLIIPSLVPAHHFLLILKPPEGNLPLERLISMLGRQELYDLHSICLSGKICLILYFFSHLTSATSCVNLANNYKITKQNKKYVVDNKYCVTAL